jgi:hypothetical protein
VPRSIVYHAYIDRLDVHSLDNEFKAANEQLFRNFTLYSDSFHLLRESQLDSVRVDGPTFSGPYDYRFTMHVLLDAVKQ